jgi:hypothetical protein
MESRIRLAELVADTVKAQNADFLATDVQTSRATSYLRIAVAVQSAVKVKLVPSSGTAFYLNNGDALVADAVIVNDVPVDDGRTWNLQTDDAAGCTVSHLTIDEVWDVGSTATR